MCIRDSTPSSLYLIVSLSEDYHPKRAERGVRLILILSLSSADSAFADVYKRQGDYKMKMFFLLKNNANFGGLFLALFEHSFFLSLFLPPFPLPF